MPLQIEIPDDIADHSEGTPNAKEHCVELVLSDTVIPLNDARLSIHIRPRILRMAMLLQDRRHYPEKGINILENGIIG